MSNWISVKDRLPEENGSYLVYQFRRFSAKCRYKSLGTKKYFLKSGWTYKRCDLPVTHWQPLPEPPKQEGV